MFYFHHHKSQFNYIPAVGKCTNNVVRESSFWFGVKHFLPISLTLKMEIKFCRLLLWLGRSAALPVDLRCSNFDVSRLRDISYQCGKELTCFFENVNADNESQFTYSPDRYVLSYKCVGFVNSTLHQLPIDLFKRYPNMEILYVANLGLKSVSRSIFETANKLVDVHLEGNNLTGELIDSQNSCYKEKQRLSFDL